MQILIFSNEGKSDLIHFALFTEHTHFNNYNSVQVGFDLKRKIQGRTALGDLNPSQIGPWARESLKLDAELKRQKGKPAFRGLYQVGGIGFLGMLDNESREKLQNILHIS